MELRSLCWPFEYLSRLPHFLRVAIFPLVDVDWAPDMSRKKKPIPADSRGIRGKVDTSVPLNRCTVGSDNLACVEPAATPSAAGPVKGEGQEKSALESFPLTGFLRIELVRLAEAEITFRPGEARSAALIKDLADIAAAEEKVSRGREGSFVESVEGGGGGGVHIIKICMSFAIRSRRDGGAGGGVL